MIDLHNHDLLQHQEHRNLFYEFPETHQLWEFTYYELIPLCVTPLTGSEYKVKIENASSI